MFPESGRMLPWHGHSPPAASVTGDRLCERGFTLIEIVVALLIFALSFGVLAQIFQTGFRQSALAEAMTTATLIARSQLARVGPDLPLEAGELVGEAGEEFRWRTVVRLAGLADDEEASPEEEDGPGIAIYQVEVTVAWGGPEDERSLTLTSLRLGAPPR